MCIAGPAGVFLGSVHNFTWTKNKCVQTPKGVPYWCYTKKCILLYHTGRCVKAAGPAGVFQGSVHNLCWDTLTMTRTHPLKVGKIWRVNGMRWEWEQDRNGSWGQKSGPSNMRMRETSEGVHKRWSDVMWWHEDVMEMEISKMYCMYYVRDGCTIASKNLRVLF